MSDYLDDRLKKELQREQTAATILAALIQASMTMRTPPEAERLVARAVTLADELRVELDK